MNDDTNQRAIALANACEGDPWELVGFFREKARQAEDRATAASEAAVKFAKRATSAREEALREAAEVFGPVFQYLREAHRTSVDAPGHMHDAPGIWDDGNGSKSGTACEWCATWNRAVDYFSLITGGGERG